MKAVIEAAFPVCTVNGCVTELSTEQIYIQDPKTGSCIVTTVDTDANFTINNPGKKNIAFVAIDKCIWGDDCGHKKCDFAVTDSTTFAFVEIKNTGNRSSDHKKHAKEQLEETIKRFVAAPVEFTGMPVVAVISWKYVPARPIASTAMQDSKVHFWNTYKVDLLEGNEMSF